MDFVPCSGANRRRMNIVSDIERPDNEQCNSVEFDWEELFGGDGEDSANSSINGERLSIPNEAAAQISLPGRENARLFHLVIWRVSTAANSLVLFGSQ